MAPRVRERPDLDYSPHHETSVPEARYEYKLRDRTRRYASEYDDFAESLGVDDESLSTAVASNSDTMSGDIRTIPFTELTAPASSSDEKATGIGMQNVEDDADSSGTGKGRENAPGSPARSNTGESKALPARLTEMWTRIDRDLSATDMTQIMQSTFAEYNLRAPLSAQPWMKIKDESDVIGLEKARISNDGIIPPLWKEAAKASAHGRKWLQLNLTQEHEKALARARDNATEAKTAARAAQVKAVEAAAMSEVACDQAIRLCEQSKTASKKAEKAKEAAGKAIAESDETHAIYMITEKARDRADEAADKATAELKALEQAHVDTMAELRGEKRKMSEDAKQDSSAPSDDDRTLRRRARRSRRSRWNSRVIGSSDDDNDEDYVD